MKLIKQEAISQKIEKEFDYKFVIEEDGLYLFEIIASAKSWQQNLLKFISFFKDDNLAVKIDEIEFLKMNRKRGLFDGEIAWNGNNLKGLSKTCVFATPLNKGKHLIHFLVKQNPFLKSIKISQIEDSQKITYIPTENNPAEDGNRRQWMSFVIMNLKAKNLSIQARANSHKKGDDDDIKLIINGEVQKNNAPKAHKYWYWCGRVSKGEEIIFTDDLDSTREKHYIELWADRRPFLYKIEVGLKEKEQEQEEKRIPTVDDPEWTGNFNDDSEQMILARAIWGEARGTLREVKIGVAWSIKNRIGTLAKWDNYHNTILEENQYSCFWEVAPKDANLKALQSPLKNQDNYKKWKEVCEIAGQVMSGEIKDPINGANHYYDDSIKAPYWATEDNFVIKIENVIFHKL